MTAPSSQAHRDPKGPPVRRKLRPERSLRRCNSSASEILLGRW